jgi:hypothetical protein
MRIDVAYCVELNRVIDIHTACLEYSKLFEAAQLNNRPTPEKFNFLCSDPLCRNDRLGGVRVIGVNHHKSPEEQEVTKSAHFRNLDDHIPTCEWVELEEALKEDDKKNDDKISAKRKKLIRKVKRLITRFVIPDIEENSGGADNEPNPDQRRRQRLAYAHGAGSTATSLEALVSCYEELKSEKALDEPLSVLGSATSFREVFRQFTQGSTGYFSVLHGGARLFKRYGDGFSLNFIDKHHNFPVSFYVSNSNLRSYRPGARLKRIVDEIEINADKRPYIKVYWIGGLEQGDNFFRAQFKGLAHVVFRVVYPANS